MSPEEKPGKPIEQTHLGDVELIESSLSALGRRARLATAHSRLAKRTGINVDRAGYVVLSHIDSWQPLRLTDLASGLGIAAPTATQHVARLEAQGYIERIRDSSDGRVCLVALTVKGRETLSAITRYRREAINQLLGDWSEVDRRQLGRLLDRLVTALVAGDVRSN